MSDRSARIQEALASAQEADAMDDRSRALALAPVERSDTSPSGPSRRAARASGVRVAVTASTYDTRVGALTESEWELMEVLYTCRCAVRLQLARVLDPLPFVWGDISARTRPAQLPVQSWLSSDTRHGVRVPDAMAGLDDAATAAVLDRRMRAAQREANRRLRTLAALRMVAITHERRGAAGSSKDTALRACGLLHPDARNGRGALDVITLSQEGLKAMKERLGIARTSEPSWKSIAAVHAQLAHSLIAPALYVALMTGTTLGLYEIEAFDMEKTWAVELAQKEGLPEHGVYRRPVPRTDVLLRARAVGSPPEQTVELCVELDRGTERTSVILPSYGQPTQFLRSKFDGYYELARRLKETKTLAFVVPSFVARGTPRSRGAAIRTLYEAVRRDQEGLHPAKLDQNQRGVELVGPEEPTPERFASWLARILAQRAQEQKGATSDAVR